MALPDLTVLLDDGTGTFPWDISRYALAADGYTIGRGRDDWQGAVTAGQLDLSLNNSTGLFTPGYLGGFGTGPFGGGGFVDQQIRVKETINGVTYTRFTGYVKSWPVTWPATVSTFSTVRLTATDAQARAERRPLRSMLEEEILTDAPAAYYTLGESDGSTSAGDTSGHQNPPLTIAGTGPALTFGNGTGPVDGLSAATFANGQYLRVQIPGGWSVAGFECWASSTVAPTTTKATLLGINDDTGLIALNVADSLEAPPGGGAAVAPNWTSDGRLHHVVYLPAVGLYCDDVLFTPSLFTIPPVTSLTIGGGIVAGGVGGASAQDNWTGTIAHLVLYLAAPSSGRVAAHYLTGVGTPESGTARLTRLAGYANVPVGTLDTSLTTIPASSFSGSSAGEQIQKTTDAELGLTFISGTGALTFHNRNRVASKTAPDLTLSSQWVTPDVAPVVDDQQLINYMEVTAEGTGATALVRKPTSETAHGRYSGSQSYLVQTDQEALDRGNWIVNNFGEPTPRYGTLTINLYGMTPAMASSVIAALELNCWLRVTSMAPQNPGGTIADVIVQAFHATVTGEGWAVACNVVSRSLYAGWVLDNATYSVLDTTTRLYV